MIQAYAITNHGNGYVQEIGTYEDVEEIRIHCGMFAPDVVITLEHYDEEQDNLLRDSLNKS